MIKQRRDVTFFIITKRIHRFAECIPDDWGDGYDNVHICCTCENQKAADFRLPIFLEAPIKQKSIICEPLLEQIDLSRYLDKSIIKEEILPAIEDDDWDTAEKRFAFIAKDWDRYKKTSAFFIDTQSVNEVDCYVSRAYYYIKLRNQSNAAAETAFLEYRFDFLHANEIPDMGNLF